MLSSTMKLIIVIICLLSIHVFSFGFVPKVLIAQIARLNNPDMVDDLETILTAAFDGYYKRRDYTFPGIGALTEKFNNDYNIFDLLSTNPTPFALIPTNDTTIKPLPAPQTNGPWLGAQSITTSLKDDSNLWGKAQNIVGLCSIVADLHDPFRNINLYNTNFINGDQSGELFQIDYTSPNGTKFDSLAQLSRTILGLYSKESQLCYSSTEYTKDVAKGVELEAKRLMNMFPTNIFHKNDIEVPETFTRNGINYIFKDWSRESYLHAMDMYNSILIEKKTLAVEQQLNGLLSDNDFNHELYQTLPINTSLVNDMEPIKLNPAQLIQFKYIFLKQLVKAGYRLGSVLSRVNPAVGDASPKIHFGYVSHLYRGIFIVTTILTVGILYMLIRKCCKISKLKKKIVPNAEA